METLLDKIIYPIIVGVIVWLIIALLKSSKRAFGLSNYKIFEISMLFLFGVGMGVPALLIESNSLDSLGAKWLFAFFSIGCFVYAIKTFLDND